MELPTLRERFAATLDGNQANPDASPGSAESPKGMAMGRFCFEKAASSRPYLPIPLLLILALLLTRRREKLAVRINATDTGRTDHDTVKQYNDVFMMPHIASPSLP